MTDLRKYILIVEDDDELAGLVKEYLESTELRVEIEETGLHAANRILNDKPDLVILDLMLPGKDGISICREVRPFYTGPILMLTASNESVDQIISLEVGADDYVQKPVEPRILLARIRSLLRRTESSTGHSPAVLQSTQSLQIGEIEIMPNTRQVKVAGNDIKLTNPEYDILLLLAENLGQILSRDDIFKAIRGIEYDGHNRLVDITVSQLRGKLGCDGISDKHIKTIRNKGYLFVEAFD